MHENLVKDWMTADPIIISGRDTLPDAYWLMIQHDIRRLPVVDDGKLMGILTMEDLRRVKPSNNIGVNIIRISDVLSQLPVRQIMTPDPFTTHPGDTLLQVATVMLEHKISALPVIEDERVVGIITESDIFRAFVAFEREKQGEKE